MTGAIQGFCTHIISTEFS